MENMVNDHTMTGCPGVRFAPPALRTIYALCIDRFEDLDLELRSSPTPKRAQEAAREKACVETIIRLICNAGMAPVLDGTAVCPTLELLDLAAQLQPFKCQA